MALKGIKKSTADEPKGIDYSHHLGDQPVQMVSKPITVQESVSKGPKGTAPDPSVSETVHKGVFSPKNSGMLIGIEGGRVINLGNYESARIGITLTVPCDPDTLNDAYEWATDFVSSRIEQAVSAATGK